ncbi:MAG: riboflavin biosynthesis protein RibF, partial [Polymorphobacter sp.]
MQVFSLGERVAAAHRGGVVALGNFDGFHAGHQAVVGRALARARADGRPALVATFDPHPATLFRPDAPPFALTRLDQKLELLAGFGIDATVVMPFDAAFAALSAEQFVGDWLHSRIGAAAVVSGADFTFGARRSGDTAQLAVLGQGHGIAAEVVAAVSNSGGTISSTRIRAALRDGDVAAANALLTRPFALRGTVQHGAKLGRTLGFPTANLVLGDYLRPRFGVYAVRARLPDGSVVGGVANLGIRPMIEPPLELLETFLFDWAGDLYG